MKVHLSASDIIYLKFWQKKKNNKTKRFGGGGWREGQIPRKRLIFQDKILLDSQLIRIYINRLLGQLTHHCRHVYSTSLYLNQSNMC